MMLVTSSPAADKLCLISSNMAVTVVVHRSWRAACDELLDRLVYFGIFFKVVAWTGCVRGMSCLFSNGATRPCCYTAAGVDEGRSCSLG